MLGRIVAELSKTNTNTNTNRGKWRAWKTWTARIAFAGSILALLGTSRPRWTVDATISGANDGGAPTKAGTALLVNVDASRGPELAYTNRLGARIDPQWARLRSEQPTKTALLLPPGASLYSLSITGYCNGGCCSNEKCVPTPGSFLRATIDQVTVWTKTTRLADTKVVVQSGPKKENEKTYRTPHLIVEVEGDAKTEVIVSSSTTPFPGDWNGKPTQLSNCIDPTASGAALPPRRASSADDASAEDTANEPISDAGAASAPPSGPKVISCVHYPFSKPQKDPIEITVSADALTYGACPDPNVPCAPPSDEEKKPPKIVFVRATTEY